VRGKGDERARVTPICREGKKKKMAGSGAGEKTAGLTLRGFSCKVWSEYK
jgi:hypothetical protein